MRKRNTNYFNLAAIIFFGILAILLLSILEQARVDLFDKYRVSNHLIEEEDDHLEEIEEAKDEEDLEENLPPDDSCKYSSDLLAWSSLDGRRYKMNVFVCNDDIERAKTVRENSNSFGHEVWTEMYQNDKSGLGNVVSAYKKLIKKHNLDYMESLNLVCSSAQHDEYTFIEYGPCQGMSDDCAPRGCCSNVKPFAVYSPIEYIVQRTGDCDTKSLYAYTILKELGFDVALAHGDARNPDGSGGPHCVLAVAINSTPKGGNTFIKENSTNKKYYLWEMTARDMHLGEWTWTASNMRTWELYKP